MRLHAHGAGLIAQTQSGIPHFSLDQPESIDEASDIVIADPEATVAAGCTDLIARLREGQRVQRLISLRRIAELREVEVNAVGELELGALVTHHRGATHPVVAAAIPNLARAWEKVATVRIRYTATLGGNLMAGRHRYEMPLIMGALDAASEYDRSGRILTRISVPTADLVYFGYERSMRPLTTVALSVRRSAQSLSYRARVGSEYRQGFELSLAAMPASNRAEIDEIANGLAEQLPEAAGDYCGSAPYRRHLVRVLLTRLILESIGKEQAL